MKGFFCQLATGLVDLIWPRRCPACGIALPLPNHQGKPACFCQSCALSVIEITSPFCLRCGIPFSGQGPDHLCADCLSSPPRLASIRSVFVYGGAMAEAITRFKYRPDPTCARPLARLMLPLAQQMARPEMIVPVPLHGQRLRQRGFNQASLLASYLAHALDLPLVPSALRRQRATRSQAGLSKMERTENVRGAFCADSRRVSGSRVLLVDDVFTTGATFSEAAAALRSAGSTIVDGISLVRVTSSPGLDAFWGGNDLPRKPSAIQPAG